jgi:large subunit ribosomal protein L1
MGVSKRQKGIQEQIELRPYAIDEAIGLLKSCSAVKFDETVEVSVHLGVDAKKSDQAVRGATVLPHGTGKTVRVAVFAQGDLAEAATKAGADIVGFDDLADDVKKGKMDFDVVIASPDAMRLVGQLGQILGPKGLMPNPKVGTVTKDVAAAVKNVKGGQARYRIDKAGIIHSGVGKVSFEVNALVDNIKALVEDLKRLKPSSSKGVYLKKISVSSTMGPGILVDISSVAS